MTGTLKAALLGAGFMAETHGKSLLKLGGIEVIAICSRSSEKAGELAGKLAGLAGGNTAKVYCDFEKMLEENSIDMLMVCLPPFAHRGQVEAAARKGIHIFMEKPVALDTTKAQSMQEAILEAGVVSQVGYHMRFGGAVVKLKQLIDDGIAGKPVLFDARFACNSLHSPWWRDREKSGGQVLEQAIHLYDMAMNFLGEPETAAAFTANLCHGDVPGYTVEDNSVSAIRFKSGALASITATNCAVPMEWSGIFTVVCENVTAHFEDANHAIFVYTSKDPVKREHIASETDMYLEEIRTFVQAVRGGETSPCTIEQGCKSLCLVETAVKSSDMGGQGLKLDFLKSIN